MWSQIGPKRFREAIAGDNLAQSGPGGGGMATYTWLSVRGTPPQMAGSAPQSVGRMCMWCRATSPHCSMRGSQHATVAKLLPIRAFDEPEQWSECGGGHRSDTSASEAPLGRVLYPKLFVPAGKLLSDQIGSATGNLPFIRLLDDHPVLD